MTLLEALAWLLALPPAVLLLWFTFEVLAGLRPPASLQKPAGQPPRTAVLIPAHNEEGGIAETLTRLGTAPWLHTLVVADNCTDQTAALARQAGAEVIERQDPALRGKGFALAYGRDHLAGKPANERPAAVVVLDADCSTDQASVALLAQQALLHEEPVQARNLLTTAGSAPPLTQISNFAMLVKNLVRARGLQRIGGGIPLFGTGMAFPWPIFSEAELATDHLVEDMQLALQFARQGIRVKLVEQASVLSAAAPEAAAKTQRSRWERGFLGTARRQALPMLVSGIVDVSRHRFALGMHLMVPPLALLLLVSGMSLATVAALSVITGSWTPPLVLLLALLCAQSAVAIAWHKEGRQTLSATAALKAPLYILWKVPLYLGLLRKSEAGWTRTRRVGERD